MATARATATAPSCAVAVAVAKVRRALSDMVSGSDDSMSETRSVNAAAKLASTAVPMIDIHAPAGTFADAAQLAVDTAPTVMAVEGVPDISMFRDNTAAYVHELPPGSFSDVNGSAHHVRVQVLTKHSPAAGSFEFGDRSACVTSDELAWVVEVRTQSGDVFSRPFHSSKRGHGVLGHLGIVA
nr:hypothetical protein [Gordonia sputi]